MTLFYIVDLRREWRGHHYITFWRPLNANYAWPLIWAGKYDQATVDAAGAYYLSREGRSYIRFPVPCEVADALGVAPRPGDIDGNTGPVVLNTKENRATLRAAMYRTAKLAA